MTARIPCRQTVSPRRGARATSRLALAVAGVLLTGGLAPTTAAQTLTERIEMVRQKRAEDEAARRAEVRGNTADRQTQMLQRLFYIPVSVNFRGTPARDAIEYLRTTLDINMVTRYRDDSTGVGIDPETPIDLELEGVQAIEILELVLEQCSDLEDATWQIRNGYIEVGTKDRLSAATARYTAVYPVDDLLYQAPKFYDAPDIQLDNLYRDYPYGYAPYLYGGYGAAPFMSGNSVSGSIGGPSTSIGPGPGNLPHERDDRGEKLADQITLLIEPDAWERNGGTWATLRYTEGMLIVNAPEFIHRQLGGAPKVPQPK